MNDNIILLSHDEQQLRLNRVRQLMKQAAIDALLIADFANLYYLTGRVYSGYAYIAAEMVTRCTLSNAWRTSMAMAWSIYASQSRCLRAYCLTVQPPSAWSWI